MNVNLGEGLSSAFKESLPCAELFYYESTDSTNTRAKELARSGREKRDAFFIAKTQSAGRGRLGRSFSSAEGGLYLSYLTYPDMPAKDVLLLTVFAAVCVCDTVFETAGIRPGIKWVNDVLISGKKLSGILTEGAFDEIGRLKYAVVGIGVNLYDIGFPPEISDIAVSLEGAVGKRVGYSDFALRLCKRLSSFDPSENDIYIEKYREYSAVLGKEVRVLDPGGEYLAAVVAINQDGSLTVIPKGSGEERRVFSGEISIKL
ncbi:MAG: biotin--[Clostridia bacterium]|nr:biotin--[acetyl-CoA-carboxylase] ligase [Clostridia bacterium]